jgi:hypothetical protein
LLIKENRRVVQRPDQEPSPVVALAVVVATTCGDSIPKTHRDSKCKLFTWLVKMDKVIIVQSGDLFVFCISSGPVPVLVMSLIFIASVFVLHIWGKYTRG